MPRSADRGSGASRGRVSGETDERRVLHFTRTAAINASQCLNRFGDCVHVVEDRIPFVAGNALLLILAGEGYATSVSLVR